MPYKTKEERHQYYLDNKEKSKEQTAAWGKANRESKRASYTKWANANPEKVKARRKAHYENNKEEALAYSAAYRLDNPEKVKEDLAQWRKENKEKNRSYLHKRRAKKTEAGGFFTPEEWFTLCFAVGFKCLCCKEQKILVADHVVPIALGGTSWLYNIQPLCSTCNGKKGTKIIDYRDSLGE
jgi:5-methylcytosine-specific restriction endonuclease McrA